MNDPYNLQRFVDAQNGAYEQVVQSSGTGAKEDMGGGSFFRRSKDWATVTWRKSSPSPRERKQRPT